MIQYLEQKKLFPMIEPDLQEPGKENSKPLMIEVALIKKAHMILGFKWLVIGTNITFIN